METSKPLRLNLQYFAEDLITEDEVADDDFDFSEESESEKNTELTEPQGEQPQPISEEQPPAPNDTQPPEQPQLAPPTQPSPQLTAIERLANAYGMSTDKYILAVENQAHEAQIQAQLDKGIPREYAERLLNLENQSKLQQEKEALAQRQVAEQKQFADFVAKYPDVKELPPEVISGLEKGVPLTYAYAEYENKSLKAKLAAYEKNTANKQKSTGSMQGDSANEDTDDFLAGFNGG